MEWNAGSTNQEWYVYDANGLTDTITFDSSLEIVLHNGTTTTTRYYTVGGQRVAMRTGSTLYYLLNDDQGGTSLVLTSGGGVQAVQLYAPYGAVRYNQGTVPTTYNYTGQRLDSETGLLYYGFRYYDPLVGQFVRADSVETNAGGRNGYGYVGENPETRTDPTGHALLGEGGQIYHPGSPFYIQGGQAYAVHTGQLYNSNGFTNGWRPGQGPNANNPSPPPNRCTLGSCTVTLGHGPYHRTYSLSELKNRQDRYAFLNDFYREFASGYGKAELDFFQFLNSSGRLQGSEYWDTVDYDLARDELLAAFDLLNHHSAQNTVVNAWLTFMTHRTNDNWWTAHNGSINAGDQQARASGLYGKESLVEQGFINETVHVINGIQFVSRGSWNPLNGFFSPEASTTGTLSNIFYPQQYNDRSDVASFLLQGAVALGIGGGAGGPIGQATGVGAFLSLLL